MSKIRSLYFERNRNFLAAIGWADLRSLGESRMVQSSYYWLVLVPICARLLDKIASPLKFRAFGGMHQIDFTLPFSWYLLYFSALAFACGALLYRLYCPKIISEFASFSEYRDAGGEGFRLENEIDKALPREMIHDSPIWQAFRLAAEKHLRHDREERNYNIGDQVIYGVREMPVDGLSSVFFTIRLVVNHSHPRAIRMTSLCFGLGMVLLAMIFAQNINFVILQLHGGVPLLHWPF